MVRLPSLDYTFRIYCNLMFYRRKVLLGLLEALNREVSRIDLQKYLFLVCQAQEKPSYHFVPYKFGCYSFQVEADKRTLTKYGLIGDQERWMLAPDRQFFHLLTQSDQTAVGNVVARFGAVRGRDLIRYVYRTFPYFAINSQIRDDVLSAREQTCVEASRPRGKPARLFTIGYEGQSLEQYLNKLIAQSVSVLCDVRRNPVSMKYGFSKRQLKHACDGLGIHYVHMPELGIDSSKRKGLESANDYEVLFCDYIGTVLRNNSKALDNITLLVRDHGRVALTCFEAEATRCHRGCVVQALQERPDFRHRVCHL